MPIAVLHPVIVIIPGPDDPAASHQLGVIGLLFLLFILAFQICHVFRGSIDAVSETDPDVGLAVEEGSLHRVGLPLLVVGVECVWIVPRLTCVAIGLLVGMALLLGVSEQ